jgi:hypothetical protein
MRRLPKHLNPLLYRIVHGNSSTGINLAKTWRGRGTDGGVFQNTILNRSIIFKLPHFGDEDAMRRRPTSDQMFDGFVGERPIETGIFIPDNHENPDNGGHAVYLHQPAAEMAFEHQLGINLHNPGVAAPDIETLRLLDDLPSLDPFLVKLRYEHCGKAFPGHLIAIKEDEERGVRRLIENRIAPIFAQALKARHDDPRIQEVMNAIWDPRLPEAREFIRAFGIPADQVDDVVFAIKGVGFYEYSLMAMAAASVQLPVYLANDSHGITDKFKYRSVEIEVLNSFRQEIHVLLQDHEQRSSDAFKQYHSALSAFLQAHDPRPIQKILGIMPQIFWTLGHTVTAIANAETILACCLRDLRPAYTFNSIETTLFRLRAALLPRL